MDIGGFGGYINDRKTANSFYNTAKLSNLKSFIESEVPHLRLFPMLSMMPLKRWLPTENVLTPY